MSVTSLLPAELDSVLRQIAKEPGMVVQINKYVRELKKGKKIEKPDTNSLRTKYREMCDFAQVHNLVIHPGKGYDYYIESFFMFNRCPCDPARKNCPCPESIKEVETTGHCLCRLFWKSNEVFKQQMIGAVT